MGANAENAKKLLFTLIFIGAALPLRVLLGWLSNTVLAGRSEQARFWSRRAIKLGSAVLLLGLLSIWFEDPTGLAAALGLSLGEQVLRLDLRHWINDGLGESGAGARPWVNPGRSPSTNTASKAQP